MILAALGSALLGLALAWAAALRLPHRLPARPLVLSTGVAGALFGHLIVHGALDSAGTALSLLGALIVSAASLSLLIRPSGRLRRRSLAA